MIWSCATKSEPGVVTCHIFLHRDDVGHRDLGYARGDYGKGDRVHLMRLFSGPSWCTSETYDQAYELAYDDHIDPTIMR